MLFIRNGKGNLNRLQKARVDFSNITAGGTGCVAARGVGIVGFQCVAGAITAASNRVILGIQFGGFAVEMVGKTVFNGSVSFGNFFIGTVFNRYSAVTIYVTVVSRHAAAGCRQNNERMRRVVECDVGATAHADHELLSERFGANVDIPFSISVRTRPRGLCAYRSLAYLAKPTHWIEAS